MTLGKRVLCISGNMSSRLLPTTSCGRAARNARNPLIPADDRPHAIEHDQADVHSVKHCAKHKIGLVGLFNQHDRKIVFRYRG